MRLYSRHKTELTNRFPELLLIYIPPGTGLDGELVVTDQNGYPDFESMMRRFQSGKNGHPKVEYCIFDIIYYNGEKVTHLPLLERLELLTEEVTPNETFAIVPWVRGKAEELFNLTKQQDLEGM